MSNINDNNLDDLLRRAAEKYPLRTDSADWDKLVSDLDKDPSLILPPLNAEDRRRRRRFFWLFLLLPLAGVGYYTWHLSGKSTLAQHAVEKAAPAGQEGQTSVPAGQDGKNGRVVEGKAGQTDVPAGQSGKVSGGTAQGGHVGGESAVAKEKGGTTPLAGSEGKTDAAAGRGRVKGMNKQDVQTGATAGQGGHAGGQDIAAGAARNGRRGGHVGGNTGNDPDGGNAGKDAVGRTKGSKDDVTGLGRTGLVDGLVKNDNGKVEDKKVEDKELTLATNNMHRAPTKGNVAVNIPVQPRTFPKDSAKKERQKHSFYVGIIGSPDLSSIKFQSVKNVGTRYGVLLGYTLNERWSLETGVSYGKKKYYTDGEYFNKGGVNAGPYVLNHVDQLKVQGSCDMWEIPLNVRYNLTTSGKMKWFATAGVSAYYMSRENYYCWGDLYGSPWGKGWDSTPSRNAWSTNLSLSIGYEQKIGKIGNLRLEPYVRVPISGVGTGKLSILSAGLNIGITRKLW